MQRDSTSLQPIAPDVQRPIHSGLQLAGYADLHDAAMHDHLQPAGLQPAPARPGESLRPGNDVPAPGVHAQPGDVQPHRGDVHHIVAVSQSARPVQRQRHKLHERG